MNDNRCPKCDHRLYPCAFKGVITKVDRTRKMENGSNPIIAVEGYTTWLTCRHCGFKKPKPLMDNTKEKIATVFRQNVAQISKQT